MESNAPVRVGVAGLGTVGTALIKLLERHGNELASRTGRPIILGGVSARDVTKDRGVDVSAVPWFEDPAQLAVDPGNDVFVELIGGAEGPAKTSVEAALAAGKHVVTANKALLASHGNSLAQQAEETGAILNFEAAVAGGIPIIKTMREALAGNTVSRVYGILNGTCNYILTRMEQDGLGFAECLAEAQRLGYAEADPSFDIGGQDAAHKLALLTSIAFGAEVDSSSIYVEGITSISSADIEAARDLGYRIRLLAVACRTDSGIEQRVHPTMVRRDSAIARVDGVTNAVAVEADFVGHLVLLGPGAGGEATASSVISDIADIARGSRVGTLGRPARDLEPYRRAGMRAHEGGYYVRLSVYDRPGAFAAIASRVAERGISLESIVQRRPSAERADQEKGGPVPVIMITHDTTEAEIRSALDAIRSDGQIAADPQMIRIEAFS